MVDCRYAYRHPKRKWQINCSNRFAQSMLYNKECSPSRCGHKKSSIKRKRQKYQKTGRGKRW